MQYYSILFKLFITLTFHISKLIRVNNYCIYKIFIFLTIDGQQMAPIQFIINFFSFSLAAFIIYWSNAGHLKNQIRYLFEHKKLDTAELQADHLADFTYFYAAFMLILSSIVQSIRFFRKQFNQVLNPDTKLVSNINKTIAQSFEHFLIFASIYVYLLQKKGFGLNTNAILLMPTWFLLGRVGAFIEQLLTQLVKNKYTFSYFGFILTVFPYFAMIGQVFGYSPFKLL